MDFEDLQVVQYSDSSFLEEHLGNFNKAYTLHEAAIASLRPIAEDHKDKETRKIAKRQIEFHSSRLPILRSIIEGHQELLPTVLPTSLSAEESLNTTHSGYTAIGLEELLYTKYLIDSFEKPDIRPPSQIGYLLKNPVPAYAPTLDPTLPPTKFNIGVDMDTTAFVYWFKAHPAIHPDQTFYVLRANRWAKTQFDDVTFHRSTEFATPCIDINIAPVQFTGNKYLSALKGRPMEYIPSNSLKPIQELPDRLEKRPWGPQRFTYAGRQFAWVTEDDKMLQLPVLYETEKVWADPSSKTGKKEHKVVGPKLCWGDYRAGFHLNTLATVEVAGGVDQIFTELLLASQMTKLAVFMFGHDA
ncbi:hypothetical protein ABW19_dt0202960 [Dactylella cylindrospora]|nr:hypothetical protein ABW19_dt0202960 [Dactylella cylindrospora]